MRFLLPMLLSLATVGISLVASTEESPGFFLKITKNIPRLGRRSDKKFENFFFKNAKQIPRIGRRNEADNNDPISADNWTDEITSRRKRALMNPPSTPNPWQYSVVQPVNVNTLIELIEKDAIPSDNIKFVHWKDFDRALQFDRDLYSKVVSLGRRPDRQLKEDLRFRPFLPFFGRTDNNDGDLLYQTDNNIYSNREKDFLNNERF